MIIGVDIDNVIADTEKRLRAWIYDTNGLKVEREDITSYALDTVPGMDEDTLGKILKEFRHGDIFLDLDVMEGAKDTLDSLYVNHRIVLVTSRPHIVEEKTRQWLSEKNIPFHELIFNEHTKVNGTPYEVFIEDQGNFATELADDGTFVLLYDAPWNRHIEHDNMDRVFNWEDIRKFMFPPCATGHS
jgi:hypothetical protein